MKNIKAVMRTIIFITNLGFQFGIYLAGMIGLYQLFLIAYHQPIIAIQFVISIILVTVAIHRCQTIFRMFITLQDRKDGLDKKVELPKEEIKQEEIKLKEKSVEENE